MYLINVDPNLSNKYDAQCPPYLVVKEDDHENNHNNKEESFSLADLDLHHYFFQASLKMTMMSANSHFFWMTKVFFHSFFKSLLLEILVMGATFWISLRVMRKKWSGAQLLHEHWCHRQDQEFRVEMKNQGITLGLRS